MRLGLDDRRRHLGKEKAQDVTARRSSALFMWRGPCLRSGSPADSLLRLLARSSTWILCSMTRVDA